MWGQELLALPSVTNLCLFVKDDIVPSFFKLLQQGFMVRAQVGCSIKALLCEQLGVSPEYLEERIQTIFLDGRPVDDLNSANVKDGSTLAFSAAVPGLAGATLRKGGFYAPMRSQISYREVMTSKPLQEGMVLLKLFNLLLRDLGPSFLKRGVWINGKDLSDFFERQPDDFWAGCHMAQLGGKDLDVAELLEVKWPDREVFLQVRVV
jgi:hypothetical protein